ncbi:carboxypeptidase-like regulatory domain-containing protein [Hymenobacter sp. NBH84]|uniref:Carboxypeptidase-like regulatory domain-containing protein n=1 Tax=Hymenobacter defluvii TaxID=2054411 RepID=A0ABS3TGJ0_9BACT|nr:carboxypeptidase-like regulatory domain-containing protein [Hymenobacter sp. NBH84]MBO3272766.1 carboxypeptidase-like regulatory domain-containing protein [Hymenobacter defluvii]QNE41593.1 carboxypeptidase-like regulatory domain-containing protein [Hymenobacter sp. NBH84]
MLRRLFTLLAFALFLPALSFAQDQAAGQFRISGRVVDKETKEPIPFASLGLKEEQTGALTNEFGFFQMAAPEKVPQDSLIILALGYYRKAVAIKRGVNVPDMIVEVPRRVVELANVTVKGAKVKDLSLGSRNNTPGEGMIQGMPGSQYAFFVKNDKNKKLGNVRSVSFYIGENGFPREPFRVRIYRADGNYNSPNTDLLTENVVVSAPKGGEWYTVDLTTYNIEAPTEGFFVAMEWIVSGDKFYTTNFMDTYTPYGQILRPTFEFKESRTWSYTMGKGWSLLTLASNGQRYNAMIRAEVDMLKD